MPAIPKPFSNRPVSEWIAQLLQSDIAEDRLRSLQAIGLLAPPAETARWATHSLRDADPTVKALAAKLIGSTDTRESGETENSLVAILSDIDPDARFESARALIRKKSKQTDKILPVLLEFLDEPETHSLMIAAVVCAIVEIDETQSVPVNELFLRFERLLENERGEVREAVSLAFARWPEMARNCIDRLLPLLDDSEPVVREKIAEALGRAGVVTEAIRSALQAAGQDEDAEVARVAQEAIARLGDQA